jgi:hypothetical protein
MTTTIKSMVCAAVLLVMYPAMAFADLIVFQFRSNHPYTVQLSFFSQDRNHAWPGGDQAWDLDDSELHTFRLECEAGERIAWGAWDKGNPNYYWGAGNNDQYCSSCVYTCGYSDPAIQNLD